MSNMATLAPLVGKWATTITMRHPPEQKGQVHHAVDSYRWLAGERVLVHEVNAAMGGERVESLEVYSEDAGRIVSRNFAAGGEVSDYRAEMQSGAWRVEGESERFASTAVEPDVIKGLWQTRVDGAWIDWMIVELNRVA